MERRSRSALPLRCCAVCLLDSCQACRPRRPYERPPPRVALAEDDFAPRAIAALVLRRAASLARDRSRFPCGPSEPSFEARFAKSGIFTGDQRPPTDPRAGVSRLWVGDDLPWIIELGQEPPY